MIEFKKVTKKFLHHTVLEDLTFQVMPGEFVSIIGPSGAGKSTLIYILMGNKKPTQGEIIIDGIHIEDMNFEMRQLYRRHIGVVFQDYKLLPQKTVYENVAFALEVCDVNETEIHKKVADVLDLVGLLEHQDQYPRELSGGEQQRASLARALVHEPKLLIADEPTGNLDPETSMQIIDILKKINKKGTTILLTTHNEKIVNDLQRRVIALKKGKIVHDSQDSGYVYAGKKTTHDFPLSKS